MTQSMDGELKTSLSGRMPQELASELALMRRNSADFVIGPRVKCKFGCDTVKGSKSGFELYSVAGEPVGAWCAHHGWSWFDSARCPPTERLKPSEVKDRQLSAARKKGPKTP